MHCLSVNWLELQTKSEDKHYPVSIEYHTYIYITHTGPRPPSNRGPPTKPIINYLSFMLAVYELQNYDIVLMHC